MTEQQEIYFVSNIMSWAKLVCLYFIIVTQIRIIILWNKMPIVNITITYI